MPYIEAAGETLFYTRSSGPAGGPVLVLVHGAGGTHLHWPADLRRLNGATVYTLDLPGHGRTGGQGYETIEGYAGVVAAFLDTVGVEQTILVGHSMGGAIVMTLALATPSTGPSTSSGHAPVGGLVLIATGARLRVAPTILEGIRTDFEDTAELITRFAWSTEAPPRLIKLGRKGLLKTGPDVLLGDFRACDRFDAMGRLGELRIPTLVLAGSADQLTPVKYARFLAERIPNAHLAVIQGAGHMVMMERPAEVAKAVQDFLRPGAPR